MFQLDVPRKVPRKEAKSTCNLAKLKEDELDEYEILIRNDSKSTSIANKQSNSLRRKLTKLRSEVVDKTVE